MVVARGLYLARHLFTLCRCVSSLRNVIFITLATAIMIYEAGVEKEASHESHEVSVTALPKMPPPDNFEPSRGCLLSVLYLQLCICVFDIQPVNCQCFYWTAFIFMKSCLYFLSLATVVLNLKEWQRRVVLIKGCDALGEVICQNISFFVPRSCQPASQISMEDLDEGMRRKFELFTNCSFQSLPIAPWYSTHMVSLKMQPKLLC